MATPLSSLSESQFLTLISDMIRDEVRQLPRDVVMKLMLFANAQRVPRDRNTPHE